MMKQMIALLLALTLFVTLFSGCALIGLGLVGGLMYSETETGVSTEPVLTEPTILPAPEQTPTETADDPSGVPLRFANRGRRDYLPEGQTVEMVDFSEMPYERPDVDALCKEYEALTKLVEDGADAETILNAFYTASDHYLHFYTMKDLAYVRYTLDTSDSYYKAENDELELRGPDVEEKLEAFFKACAASDCRDELERQYFEAGFFDEFEDYSRYTNEEFLALSKEEEKLLAEYRTVMEDPQIEYQGQTQSYNELMARFDEINSYQDYKEYLAILKAYHEQYNEKVGEIYIKLVRVRQKIAETLGYDSYPEYCYDLVYERDYTHDEGVAFCQRVRDVIVPVNESLSVWAEYKDLSHFPMDDTQLIAGLQGAMKNMGSEFTEAFDFMLAYSLCDLRASDNKFDSSYTIYLQDYEAPFLTVNAQGTSFDFLTFSHEFGHFLDAYVTYDAEEDLETAETFSQAMEFLALKYTDGLFSAEEIELLLQLNLVEIMDTLTYQSVLARFEDGVYDLDEADLTVENINSIYRQCCKDYGIYNPAVEFYYRYGWINVTHFFEAPCYVISYAVSADTALQVYMLEAEQPGDGLAAYRRLLEREKGEGVQSVMETAGLPNPFRAEAMEELADFYRETFGLK